MPWNYGHTTTTGCRRDDLQDTQYDHCYTTAWRRLRRWEEGVLKTILDALIARGYSLGVVKMDSLSVDSITIPAKKGSARRVRRPQESQWDEDTRGGDPEVAAYFGHD